MFKVFLAVMVNELRQIFRVREISAVLVVGLVVYFFFYPIPYNNEEVRNIPIAVIDQDNSTMSQQFLKMVGTSDALAIDRRVDNLGEAKKLLKQREVFGVLVVPFNFEQNVLKGHRSAIVFYGDASYVMIYNGSATAIATIVQTMNREILTDRQIQMGVDPSIAKGNSAPFQPVIVQLFNPQSGYATYIIPPAYVLILHQCLWLGIMLACLFNRYADFNQGLVRDTQLSLPKLGFVTWLGKYVAYLFCAMFGFWIYMYFAPYWYQLPQLGKIFDIAVLGVLFLSAVIFMAMAMSTLFHKMDSIFLLMLPFSMIIFFLSGASWPAHLMPDLFASLAKLLPSTAGIDGFVRLKQMGATLEHLSVPIVNLSLLILVYGALAYYAVCRDLERVKKEMG